MTALALRWWGAVQSRLPAPLAMRRRDLWLGALGAGLGIWVTHVLGHWAFGDSQPWFIAPMGATAVLLFALPASPLAQPWPVLGGNLVAAFVGVTCQRWLGDGAAAAALAGGLAVAAMALLRCLHPPGGAVAVLAVLGGPAVQGLGYAFLALPVGLNTLCILVLALLVNNAAGRRYPHHAGDHPHHTRDVLPSHRGGLNRDDVDAALASFGEVLDIDREDIEEVIVRAQQHALHRQWRGLRCGDVMSGDLVVLGPDDTFDRAWDRLNHHKVKAVPVVDADHRLLGIVTMHDLYLRHLLGARHAMGRPVHDEALHHFMTRDTFTVRPDQPLADLVEAFSDGGLHHVPVVDGSDRLVGIVTQSDVVSALFQAAGQVGAADAGKDLSAPSEACTAERCRAGS